MSGKNLTEAQRADILKYFKALQTFFNVTGVKHDRSNSTRAQKARAKLLNLSLSQFYELSTDVYDELRRRIDEDQNKSEYLPPKENFHYKRNQARQKLASLAQTRFNDLVDDIIYEIKRRNLDSIQREEPAALPTQRRRPDITILPTASIQETKIIPQKANLNWSSDDDEEGTAEEQTHAIEDDLNAPPFIPTTGMSSDKKGQETGVVNSPVLNTFIGAKDTTASDLESTDALTTPFENKNKNATKAEPTSTTEETEKQQQQLFQKNKELMQEVEDLRAQLDTYSKTTNSTMLEKNMHKELASLSNQVSNLLIENEQYRQKISELELESKSRQAISQEVLSSKKNTLQAMRAKYPLDTKTLMKFTSTDGVILFESLESLNALINKHYDILQDGKIEYMGNALFENVAGIARIFEDLSLCISTVEHKNEYLFTKMSLAQLITSTRYYCAEFPIVPPITVHAALSDLSYAFAELVKSCKIKQGTNKLELYDPHENQLNNAIPSTPETSSVDLNKSQSFIKPALADNDGEEMSPVKPLKIAQKKVDDLLYSSAPRPPSSRKISGAGLISSVIDTSSLPNSKRSSLLSVHSSTPVKILHQNKPAALGSESSLYSSKKGNSNQKSGLTLQVKTDNFVVKEGDDSTLESPLEGKSRLKPTKVTPKSDQFTDNTEPKKPKEEPPIVEPDAIETAGASQDKKKDTNDESSTIEIDQPNSTSEPMDTKLREATKSFPEKLKMFETGRGIGLRMVPDADKTPTNEEPLSNSTNKLQKIGLRNVETKPTNPADVKPVEIANMSPTFHIEEARSKEQEIPKREPFQNIEDQEKDDEEDEEASEEEEEDFDIDAFDIANPDNTLSQLLLYLEHQTVEVISTIQSLLTSIKQPKSTKGELRTESYAINSVISQMVDATSISMNQSRNSNLKEHGSWVVQSLADCGRRMTTLCKLDTKDDSKPHQEDEEEYADKHFKQRLAGIAFDVAKCTKELVKTVEEASLKEDIEYFNSQLAQ